MSNPINPPLARGSGRRELPAYVSNGVIGIRVRDLPFLAGMTLLSGYTGEHPERKIEAAAVAPYPLAADVAIDGVWLSDVPHQVRDLEQAYDFGSGELTTRFVFAAGGKSAAVEVVTFCSRADPTLACQQVTVTVDGACDLGLRAIVDAAGVDGRALRVTRNTPGEDEPAVDGALLWESAGGLSTCGVALVTELAAAGERELSRGPLSGNRLVSGYSVRARSGRPVRLTQMASIIPSVMHRTPDHQTDENRDQADLKPCQLQDAQIDREPRHGGEEPEATCPQESTESRTIRQTRSHDVSAWPAEQDLASFVVFFGNPFMANRADRSRGGLIGEFRLVELDRFGSRLALVAHHQAPIRGELNIAAAKTIPILGRPVGASQ